MSKEKELKPCPFCGGKAEVNKAFHDYIRYWVECLLCKASAHNQMKQELKAEAITAWNTRHPDKSLVEKLEWVLELMDEEPAKDLLQQALDEYKEIT